MLVLTPDYYKKFKCIGDKCPYTCCSGWTVIIDEDSYKKYQNGKGSYNDFLKSTIKTDEENNHRFAMNKEGRCPHLSKENLCNIYSNLSEDDMCITCKKYPRTSYRYNNGMYEINLMASCPVVAEYLVTRKDSIEFELEEMELPYILQNHVCYIKSDYDNEFYELTSQLRSDLIDIFQRKDLSIREKVIMSVTYSSNCQNIISSYNMWEEKVEEIKATINSKEYMDILNKSTQYNVVSKIKFLKESLEVQLEEDHCDRSSLNCVLEYSNVCANLQEEKSLILEKEFSEYFEKYNHVYENFAVYLLFGNVMQVLNHNNIEIEVLFIALSIIMFQTQCYIIWCKNNKIITEKDIEEVIYRYCRIMEHNSKKLYDILGGIKSKEFSSYDIAKMIM